jgi:2-methylcitrate dehydratase PrpD
MNRSYTQEVVRFIADFKADFPSTVVAQGKLLVLDTVGCAIGGYCTAAGAQIVEMAKRYRFPSESSLICDGEKVCPEFAAWANSSMANVLDMDDVFAGTFHQANCLVPTAFAVGESRGLSGKDVLDAIILGFEVGSRIGLHAWPTQAKCKTYFPSTWQVFCAVAVTGRLLGLDIEELYHAFGLAGTVAPVPINMHKFVQRPMGFSKNVFGWTTLTGIFWTLVARTGARGAPDILDGDAGFWSIMGSDDRNFEKLTEGLGQRFNILDTKFKPYPFCTWGHTTLDAFSSVIAENHIRAEHIEYVRVLTLRLALENLSNPKVETIYDSQFSLPHAISMIAMGKRPGPDWMCEESLYGSPLTKSIASKVTVEHDPKADKVFHEENGLAIPSTVEVRTKDGRKFEGYAKYSKGTPKNPFTPEEIKEKFRMLAVKFSPERVDEIIHAVDNMDKLSNVSTLIRLLTIRGDEKACKRN